METFTWIKPVLCIFRERSVNPEADPFVVIKTKKLTINKLSDKEFSGVITDFFTLMGDADYLTSKEGKADHYVICWFDDTEMDTTKDLRRLRGVTFNDDVTFVVGDHKKRTYNGSFKAKNGKLK